MSVGNSFIYNGKIFQEGEKTISPHNRSFKYGDGVFETIKVVNGNIIFEDFHIERLFSSLQTLQFDVPLFFTKEFLVQEIKKLAATNNHASLARIRLTVFRGDGNLYDGDNTPDYMIQSWQLLHVPRYNEKGLGIGIYKDAKKACDIFSNIKSNNYLPYAMASIWCKKNAFNDALILNCYDRIAEATTSNLFIVKDGNIRTPVLSDGCVAGVTRRYLLQSLKRENIKHEETTITENDVLQADEMFLTNTGFYIQWVKQCGTKFYANNISKTLYQRFIIPLLKINGK